MQTRFCFSQSVSIFGVFPLDMQFLHERSGFRFNSARSYSSGNMVFRWSFYTISGPSCISCRKWRKNGNGKRVVKAVPSEKKPERNNHFERLRTFCTNVPVVRPGRTETISRHSRFVHALPLILWFRGRYHFTSVGRVLSIIAHVKIPPTPLYKKGELSCMQMALWEFLKVPLFKRGI